jgi:hypothetical protein
MKKFLVTILAFVYLTSTIGATLRLDCCLENLVKAGCSKETKGCKEDHKHAKPGLDQKRSDHHIRVAKIFPVAITTNFSAYSFHAVAHLTEAHPKNNAPPHQAAIPLFILNCVYRI